jgi:pantoate--beta-alanine ligase
MHIVRTAGELRTVIRRLSPDEGPGFVPTMGALHAGHAALVDRCVKENTLAVCSIFVNPKQFDNPQDLASYPRDESADCALLEKHGCGVAFIPRYEEVYPGDADPVFEFGSLAESMEGGHRPGHFAGMAAVVYRLFRLVEPAKAYFGEKDFQQLAVVRSLVRQSGLPVEIVPCPTVREANGLALSSRNVKLTDAERRASGAVFNALSLARDLYPAHPVADIRRRVFAFLEKESPFEPEYFEIAGEETLAPVAAGFPGPARAFIAVRAARTRLIDNLPLH